MQADWTKRVTVACILGTAFIIAELAAIWSVRQGTSRPAPQDGRDLLLFAAMLAAAWLYYGWTWMCIQWRRQPARSTALARLQNIGRAFFHILHYVAMAMLLLAHAGLFIGLAIILMTSW